MLFPVITYIKYIITISPVDKWISDSYVCLKGFLRKDSVYKTCLIPCSLG